MNPLPVVPFRWDVTRREQLGNLILESSRLQISPGFIEDLRKCCSRVISFSRNSDLFFVGRSPESLFDYLSGIFYETEWMVRLNLLHFSMRGWKEKDIRYQYPGALTGLRLYFIGMGLDPKNLALREKPVAFIDLVASGETLGNIMKLLYNWSKEIKLDWNSVKRKIRIVGITRQMKTSPNTWRWQQHIDWSSLLESDSIKNVSINWRLWDYLGNRQWKVTDSYSPQKWGKEEVMLPSRNFETIQALKRALNLFEIGRMQEEKLKLVEELTQEKAMQSSWFRQLILKLQNL
jgi:hypothetical protein